MGRMGQYGYIPCGRCKDNYTVDVTITVLGKKLYARVPCPKCKKSKYAKAMRALKRRGGSANY